MATRKSKRVGRPAGQIESLRSEMNRTAEGINSKLAEICNAIRELKEGGVRDEQPPTAEANADMVNRLDDLSQDLTVANRKLNDVIESLDDVSDALKEMEEPIMVPQLMVTGKYATVNVYQGDATCSGHNAAVSRTEITDC